MSTITASQIVLSRDERDGLPITDAFTAAATGVLARTNDEVTA